MTGLLTVAYAGLVLLATQMFAFHTPVARGRRHADGGGAVQPAAPSPAANGAPAVPPPGMTPPDRGRVREEN